MNNENQQSLTSQGDIGEETEALGGSTNLSLAQPKQQSGSDSPAEENQNRLEDEDDLNEIRAGDDLGEPNVEEYQPDEDNEATENQSANDADGNGGYPDTVANPAELNS